MSDGVVIERALAWLESPVMRSNTADIAPGESVAERRTMVKWCGRPSRQALVRLNPQLPGGHEDAFRKLTRPEGPTLEVRNRAVHRLLVMA